MQAGQTAAMICASWPAPLGSRFTGRPNSCAIASTRGHQLWREVDRLEAGERTTLDGDPLGRGGLVRQNRTAGARPP